jgi:polyisoprenyl-teichoic acid--peptidoglycan teichoic acid transferase
MQAVSSNALDDDIDDGGYYRSSGSSNPKRPSGKKGKKKSSPIWAKLLVGFGALILIVSGGILVGSKLILDKVNASIPQETLLGGAAVDKPNPSLDGPVNVLLVGTDERPGLIGSRADTIIVMHIDQAHNDAYLLSVPRDTLVDIPAFPKTKFKGSREKINGAFDHGYANGGGRAGGFELLATTVSAVTGLSFNAGAIINFDGFESIVTALGGVDMCIDEQMTSFDHDTNGHELRPPNKAMVYQVGCRHLLPWQALDYVRQRHSGADGDYTRQRHQQQFLKAIAKEALSQGLTDPSKLQKLMSSAGQALTVDVGRASLTDWIFLLKGIGTDRLQMLRTNGGTYASVTCPDGSSCQTLNATSVLMFKAAVDDQMAAFITAHPTWVAATD